MKNTVSSAYILNEREFAVLLQAKGITAFQGFELKEVPDTEEKILQTLLKLSEKGFLCSDGERFFVNREIAECLQILERAEGVFEILPQKEDVPQTFFYLDNRILVCRPLTVKQSSLKLWTVDWDDMEEVIRDTPGAMKIRYYKPGMSEYAAEAEIICRKEQFILSQEGKAYNWEALVNRLKEFAEDRDYDFS